MNISPTALEGVLLIEPRVHGDHRGFFLETYRRDRYAEHGIEAAFVQDNHSSSVGGTLRGLHAQKGEAAQGKLVRCIEGSILDVAVDFRHGSPTFGQWVAYELSSENFHQLWVPVGFLHGFLTLSDRAQVEYKCTTYYSPENEVGVIWNDPDIGIDWGIEEPVLSPRDAALPRLADVPEVDRF